MRIPSWIAVLVSALLLPAAVSWAQGNATPRLQVSPDSIDLSTTSGLSRTVNIHRTGPPGNGVITYTATVSTSSGGAWLTADPASGPVPSTMTIRATPGSLAPGEYQGRVTIRPSVAGMSSEDVSVSLRVGSPGNGGGGGGNQGPPNLMVRPGALNFHMVEGASTNPDTQTIAISSPGGSGSTLAWTAVRTVTTPPGGAWLQIAPASGTGPGNVTVSVNGAGLAPGRYEGTVTVSSGSDTSPVRVSLQVRGAKDPKLVIDPRAFNFIVTAGSSVLLPEPREMRVKNAGSGALPWTAVARTAPGDPAGWLSISPTSGNAPSTIAISANATGLAAGMYEGSVEVTSGSSTETARVFLRVLGPSSGMPGGGGSPTTPGAVQFTPRVVELRAPNAGASTTPAFVPIQITSQVPGLTFAATVTTSDGGNWLGISPSSGQVPGSITVTAGTAGLSNGLHSGMIHVRISGSVTEQRTIPVLLRIGDEPPSGSGGDTTPRLTLSQGGVVLQTRAGGPAPEPATVEVGSRGVPGGGSGISFQTAVSTTAGGSWLVATPGAGTVPASVSVSAVNTAALAPGAYRGTVVFQPAGAGSQDIRPATLQVLLIVRRAAPSTDETATARNLRPLSFGGAPDTGPSGVFLNPGLDFEVETDKPEAVQLLLFDASGAPLERARVQLSGLAGNSVTQLEEAGGGLYTGFFQASTPGAVSLTAKVSASAAGDLLRLSVGGDVLDDDAAATPVILRGGVVSASMDAPSPSPVAPGSRISIFGRNLAGGEDLRVFVGGVAATVVRIAAGAADGLDQIDVETPAEGLEGAVFADVVVLRNGRCSAPEGIVIGSPAANRDPQQ